MYFIVTGAYLRDQVPGVERELKENEVGTDKLKMEPEQSQHMKE